MAQLTRFMQARLSQIAESFRHAEEADVILSMSTGPVTEAGVQQMPDDSDSVVYLVDNDDEVLARMKTSEWLTAVMRDTPASFHIEKKGTATGVSREDGDRIFVLDGIECFAGDVYSIKVTKDTF